MIGQGETLQEAEAKAIEIMGHELASHLSLVQEGHNLIGFSIIAVPEGPILDLPLSLKVSTNLLVRISNDLRGAAILAERGYPLQALTLAASIYEATMQVAYLGNDEKIAQEWVDHDKPDIFFRKIEQLTKEVFKKLRIPDPDGQAKRDYRVYQQFCMAKHLNPLLQQHYGFQRRGQLVVAQNGPDWSDLSIKGAWFALDYSERFVYIALATFVSSHVPSEKQADLAEQINLFAAKRKELNQAAQKKWGPGDAFQGKWRSFEKGGVTVGARLETAWHGQ